MTLPTPAEDTATEALAILDSLFEGAHETFDASVDATLGIEEEFAICDPQTLDLVPRYLDIEALAKQSGLEQAVAGELLASEAEFRTGRCMSWTDAEQELTDIRARVMEIAREAGVVLGASATHPWADYREQETVPLPYYELLVGRMQYVTHRNNTFGLHVHVGVNGADRAIRVSDTLRNYQPLLHALSTSSPFLDGLDCGLASARHMIFSRSFVRGNVAPVFGSMDGYLDHLRWLRDAGSIDSVGQLWWGTRPHLMHGTVEFRMFDGQPDVRDTLALTALASGTIAYLSALDDAGELPPPVDHHLIDENGWRAARYGTDAVFADLPSSRRVSAGEAIGELITNARVAGRAAGLELDAGLDRAQQMLDAGSSTVWQRELYAQTGDLHTVYRAVVDATMSSTEEA